MSGNVYLDAWDRDGCYCDETVELVPGEMTDAARWVFTRGQCHSLALAIHEATSWPIVGAGWLDEDDGLPVDAPLHVGVRTPSGSILDIEGAWPNSERWARHNGARDVHDVDPDEAREAFYDAYREPQVDSARHWVLPVLRAYVPTAAWYGIVDKAAA